ASKASGLDLVAELCDLPPGAVWPEQVMRKIAAIAIRNGRENVSAVARTFQNDLCNSRKVFSDGVRILGVGRAELVKIDLLIKVQVGFGPLTFSGKPCVIDPGAVGLPCCTAARCRILDVGDRVRQRFAIAGLVKVKGAVFTASFGKRHRD